MPGAEELHDASIDERVAAGDVDGLIALGAAYQGGAGVPRDLFRAVECFEAASRLGSPEAEYLVGLAYMNGFGVAKDVAEGAKRLRSAAQAGSLRGKIYIANLYEMGVHYAVDRDKADVWYRNVARAAGIEADPESEAYELAMAELGCVRFCLTLVADEALSPKDRASFLKKAKSMGYAHRLKQAQSESSQAIADEIAERDAEPARPAVGDEREPEPRAEAKPEECVEKTGDPAAEAEDEPALGAQWTLLPGVLSFLGAAFFAAAGSATAHLAMTGVRALTAAGDPIPHLSRSPAGFYLGAVLALGVLPATSMYRARVVAIAAAMGGAVAAAGWFLFEQAPWLPDRLLQASAGGLGGYLLTLLFLGVLGGTRSRSR